MSDYKTRLNATIARSPIPAKQKKLWRILSDLTTEEENEALYEAVTESEENLILLTTHIKNQLYDMEKNNPVLWDKALENNEEFARLMEEE